MNKELIEKAKLCKSKEELLKLAKENSVELDPQEAELYLQEFKEGEVSDVELDNVAGGQDGCGKRNAYEQRTFRSAESVQYIFNIGDIKQNFVSSIGHHTRTVKITDRRAFSPHERDDEWIDEYYVEKISGFGPGDAWEPRSNFEK